MKKILTLFCLTAFMLGYNPCFASIKVPANTVVPINVIQKYTGKNLVSGGTVDAVIAEDIQIDNVLIFKKGDRALLNILSAKKAGFVGIPGEITISGGKVFDTNGEEHRVDFNQQINGEEKT